MNMNTKKDPTDLSNESVGVIVKYFDTVFNMQLYRNTFLKRSDFYCGITNNIESNLSRHKIEGYTACADCASLDVAGKVEAKLGEMGFDIGDPLNLEGNGGAEDSTIVYMAYKGGGFKK